MASNEKNVDVNLLFKSNASAIEQDIESINREIKALTESQKKLNKETEEYAEIQDKIDSLNDSFKTQNQKLKELNAAAEKLGDTGKKTGISIGDIAKGFGLMKIGEAIIGKLTSLFSENADIVRITEIATKALSIAFKDFVTLIKDNAEGIGNQIKDIFSNPKESIESFGTLIKDNIIERFQSSLDMAGFLADAFKKLFKGDFAGAIDAAKKAGKEWIDTQTGINNTFDRGVKFVSDTAEAIGEYVEKVTDLATKQVDAANAAKILQAESEKLAARYQNEAEKQRQLRDDTSKSIADRIAANEKLGKILDKQQEVQLKAADAAIQVAKNNVALNNTIENRVALIQAQTQKEQILSDIQGQRSEQLQNRVNLQKEENTLNQTAIDGIAKRTQVEKEFNASLIKDTTDRLEAERQALIEAQRIEEQRLTILRDGQEKGTQAWEDANQAILNSQQKLGQDLTKNSQATTEALVSENDARLTRLLSNETLSFTERRRLLDEQLAAINAKSFESEEARTAALQANTEARKSLDKAEFDSKVALTNGIGNLFTVASGFAKEGSSQQKTLAIAGATISSLVASVSAFRGMIEAIPGPVGIAAGAVAAAGALLSGLATVKKIKAVKIPGDTSTDAGTPSPTAASIATPNVSFVASSENQVANSIARQQQAQPPVKAYVVSTEVSTAQSLDRNAVQTSTI